MRSSVTTLMGTNITTEVTGDLGLCRWLFDVNTVLQCDPHRLSSKAGSHGVIQLVLCGWFPTESISSFYLCFWRPLASEGTQKKKKNHKDSKNYRCYITSTLKKSTCDNIAKVGLIDSTH